MSDPACTLAAYDELRRAATESGFERRASECVVVHYPLHGSEGFVSYSHDAPDRVDAVIAGFEERGCDFEWKVYSHDEPSDLKDRLGARGFGIGEPAACVRATFPAGFAFAGLWSGFTRPESRGRGLYRALFAARARDAAERGFRDLTVDALPTSRPILERVGFRRLATTWPCRWTR